MDEFSAYYDDAETFFPRFLPNALTFDDISLATLYSDILPRDADLSVSLSPSLNLQIPIISSDMDTVTESAMAIRMALNGGLGLIHYNMAEEAQVKAVARVKNHIHGFIRDPIEVSPEQKIGEVLDRIERKKFRFSTFPVVDENQKLLGLLSGHCVKERYRDRTVAEAMTPREALFVLRQSEIQQN